MLQKLYDWTLSLAARKTAEVWLAVIAFVESSVFLVPADVLFLPMALSRPNRAYRYALVATVGNVSGNTPDGRKVKSTIHWVSAGQAIDAEVRIYDNLFNVEDPNHTPEGQEFTVNLNPNSLQVVDGAKLEPCLKTAATGDRFQFERLGYFCADKESTPEKLVFNRTVALRDTWAKVEKKAK